MPVTTDFGTAERIDLNLLNARYVTISQHVTIKNLFQTIPANVQVDYDDRLSWFRLRRRLTPSSYGVIPTGHRTLGRLRVRVWRTE
jgi:hypothetical protein